MSRDHVNGAGGPDATTIAGELREARATVQYDGKDVAAIEHARGRLGLAVAPYRLSHVAQRGTTGALYDLVLEDGRTIPLGTITHVRSLPRVTGAIIEATGGPDVRIPAITKAMWPSVWEALLRIVDREDTGTDPADLMRTRIAQLMERAGWSKIVDLTDADARSELARHPPGAFAATNGCTYVSLPTLVERIGRFERTNLTPGELAAELRRLGFEEARIQSVRDRKNSKVRKVRYWRSPAGFDLDGDGSDLDPGGPAPHVREAVSESAGAAGAVGPPRGGTTTPGENENKRPQDNGAARGRDTAPPLALVSGGLA